MKRVMIVDDEFLVRIGIRSMLDWEAHGYQIVAEATSGQDAVAKIPSARPQIILTDLVMEPMDGLELLAFCAQQYPDIQLVVLSNYNDFEKVKRAMKLGARDFFFKLTANPQELLCVLDALAREMDERKLDQREAEQLISRNAGAIRKRLVRVMMEKAYASEEEVLRELELIEVGCDLQRPYRVLLARLADARLAGAGPEGSAATPGGMLTATLESMVQEHFLAGLKGQSFRLEDGRLALVINPAPGEEGPGFETLASQRFAALDALTCRYMGLKAQGGLSRAYRGVGQFSAALEDAAHALEQCYFMKENRLALPGGQGPMAAWPGEKAALRWRELIAAGRFDEAKALLSGLFGQFYGCVGGDLDALRQGLYRLYDQIKQDGATKGIAAGELADERGVTPYQAIFRGERLAAVEENLMAVLAGYQRRCQGQGVRRVKREIARVLAYVQDNLTGDLSVAAAARQAHMSESYFSRLFKSEMGQGFVEYVNGVRIDKARELLAGSDLRIGEIAARVGMDNPNYFSILFKKLTGMPPNEYRSRTMGRL